MSFNKICFLGFDENSFEKERIEKIKPFFGGVEFVDRESSWLDKIKDADFLIVRFGQKIDKEIIDSCKNLKYVGMYATAFDKIDIEYSKQKKIVVTNLAGYSTEAVAEFVFATLLDYMRKLQTGRENAHKGDFDSQIISKELKGKTFGIMGLGKIGKRVAEIGLGFGMDVIYFSRTRKPEFENKGVRYMGLDNLLENSDIISIHTAMDEKLKGLINKESIDKIKPGAIIISTAALGIFDKDYLLRVLKEGKLTLITDGLAEMPAEEKKMFIEVKNIICYPPIAFSTEEALRNRKEILFDNILSFINGKPKNCVNL